MSGGSGIELSIVIPTTGRQPLLERCVDSVLAQPLEGMEVLVVQDGTAPGVIPFERAGVRKIVLERNVGFAGATSAGAEAARGRFLVFLNDDVELRAGWIEVMIEAMERHPHAASACGKLLRPDGRTVDGAGDGMTRAFKAYRRGQGVADQGQFEREEEVFAASGTACIWRTEAFRSLGGFDAGFFAYYEDVDLGFRARRAGYECWYDPRAVAIHVGAASAGARLSEFESFYSVRNRRLTVAKNVPRRAVLRNLHWIAVGEAISLLRAAIHGELRLYVRGLREAEKERRRRRFTSPDMAGFLRAQAMIDRALPPLATSVWRFHDGKRLRASVADE